MTCRALSGRPSGCFWSCGSPEERERAETLYGQKTRTALSRVMVLSGCSDFAGTRARPSKMRGVKQIGEVSVGRSRVGNDITCPTSHLPLPPSTPTRPQDDETPYSSLASAEPPAACACSLQFRSSRHSDGQFVARTEFRLCFRVSGCDVCTG